MPHAVEMPSFVSDDTAGPPVLSPSRPPFDLPSHIRHSYEKTNGNGRTSSYTSIKGSLGEAPDEDLDGGRPSVNGGSVSDTGLNSIPNGRMSMSSWDHRSSRNGSMISVNGNTNGAIDHGRRSPISRNTTPRLSNGDGSSNLTNGFAQTLKTSPVQARNGDNEPVKKASTPPQMPSDPQETAPATYSSSLHPPTPQLDTSVPHTEAKPPHRVSSPPAYPPPPIPWQSTPSPPHPGASTLKHRHTLQVPKAGSGRNSRDDDVLYTSGRFSPTGISAGVRRASLTLTRRNTQSVHSTILHEEIPQDEDAARWAEAVRQKRASKRRRKDEEDDDRVVVGTKVDQNHVNWVTAYNMLTGIRFTVSRTNAKLDRPLTDADFEAKHKFSFDITGNELTPSAKYDFKFKDYAPWVFRHLRAKFKLDPADYLMSLTSKYILSELGSPGKSGSFFYFSRDYKYIIKTIHHSEHKFLRKILKEYYEHVENNPNTLLSQFYGLHRVKIPYGRKIHFVVMNNLFPPHRDIHKTFDLKGSTVGRDFKEEDLEKNPRATLKDLNWLRRNLHLEFGPEKKRIFFEQMERDVHLLQRLKIMDYSMLVGIHDLKKGNEENLRDKTLQVFQPGGDNPNDDLASLPERERGILMRTPSKIETARKARELRQSIKQEKPIPLGQSSWRMPDQMEENMAKREFTFYSDDGGFRATHEDNSPGDEIFFLSIIDCLTHYGMVKKLEHLWKGLSHDKRLISPVAPEPYGDRFIRFIEGITKSPEEAAREPPLQVPHADTHVSSHSHSHSHAHTRPPTLSESTGQKYGSQPVSSSAGTNNASNQGQGADRSMNEKARNSQEEPEPRVLTTVRSPSTDRAGNPTGQTLPVVEELGESSSLGDKSGRSRERDDQSVAPTNDTEERRPVTPMKDSTPNKSGIRMVARSSLDKELPPIPQVESPQQMQQGESIFR